MNLVLAIIRRLRAILLATLLAPTRLRLLVTTTIATKGELRHRPRIGMPMLLRRLLLLLLYLLRLFLLTATMKTMKTTMKKKKKKSHTTTVSHVKRSQHRRT